MHGHNIGHIAQLSPKSNKELLPKLNALNGNYGKYNQTLVSFRMLMAWRLCTRASVSTIADKLKNCCTTVTQKMFTFDMNEQAHELRFILWNKVTQYFCVFKPFRVKPSLACYDSSALQTEATIQRSRGRVRGITIWLHALYIHNIIREISEKTAKARGLPQGMHFTAMPKVL